MNLVDDYGSIEAGGKQFITVTTKAGNFFYIIIDRDDQGDETVHFLNLVDEADLLALMDDEEVEKYMESTGMVAPAEEETPAPVVEEKEPETEEPEVVEEPEKKPTNVNGIMAIVLVIAIGGIGGFLYFKSAKGKKSKPAGPDPDEDYSEDMDFFGTVCCGCLFCWSYRYNLPFPFLLFLFLEKKEKKKSRKERTKEKNKIKR